MVKANGDRFYYSTNDLYSVYALTDSNGTVVERYMYDPYGKVTVLDGNGTPRTVNQSLYGNPWTFTGRRLDGETGLMYYRNRMYETGLGRFVSRDPAGYAGGINLYCYIVSNPTADSDPLGLWPPGGWGPSMPYMPPQGGGGSSGGYWSDVGTTYKGMGKGALAVGKEVGYFFGDLLIGFVIVVTPECCCESIASKLDEIGYKGSSLTADAGGEYGGIKTGVKVFVAPVVAVVSVPVNGYKSVQAALDGDLDNAGNYMGQSLTTVTLLASPFAKGPGGTGGYTGVGTFGEAMYNLTPTFFRTLPKETQFAVRQRAGATCESSLIQDMGPGAVRQLQIRPRLDNGKLAQWWFTADGVCSRNGGFIIREFKASSSAPLTGRQTQAFPLLERNGGMVRGLKGGESIPQGTMLPPIRVQVVRQAQFQSSELALPALGGNN